MRSWKQGDMFLAEQESRDCFDFISSVRICGIYLSLVLGTAKLKQLDETYSLKKKCGHHEKSCQLSQLLFLRGYLSEENKPVT